MSNGVLVIEDDDTQARIIRLFLQRRGYTSRCARTAEQGLQEARMFRPDAVVLDLTTIDDGLALLKELLALDRRMKIVMLAEPGSLNAAFEGIRLGAYHYIEKPLVLSALAVTLEKALGHQQLEGVVAYYQSVEAARSGLSAIIGQSASTVELRHEIQRMIDAEAAMEGLPGPNTLIEGETGSGKALAARALHFDGPRAKGPWVAARCSQISDAAFDAVMFGSETGETEGGGPQIGLLEAASGGTLYLDEVSEMTLAAQARLLQTLETRRVRRQGGVRDREVDVRVIASTKHSLAMMSETGAFCAELFRRLGEATIVAAPLRERVGDIPVLAEHFLAASMRCYGRSSLSFSYEALSTMLSYRWPGNVRELRNVIGRSALLATSPRISPAHLGLETSAHGLNGYTHAEAEHALTEPATSGFLLPEEGVQLEEVECTLITQAMHRARGNVSKAARLLGLTRDTLRYRLSKFEISAEKSAYCSDDPQN